MTPVEVPPLSSIPLRRFALMTFPAPGAVPPICAPAVLSTRIPIVLGLAVVPSAARPM
jgi:hypothetical protein